MASSLCIPKNVLASQSCTENPAGVSNLLYAVPIEGLTIAPDDEANQYSITGSGQSIEGYRIDFKAQTGQVTSEDNGMGKGWSCTATGRVELAEDDMAWTSRVLHNSDKYLYFIATGKSVDGKKEFIVIGNENGEAEWTVAADTGTTRSDDHGQTFTVTCGYQLYPLTKWYGTINQAQ
jgi:hypothetical protein